jgi:hypothetical protein
MFPAPQPGCAAPGDAALAQEPDPLVEAFVQQVMAPYAACLPPEAAAELREVLEVVLETHPGVAPVVDRLRRLRPPARSGARPKRGGGEP